jgi:hypothetical protein
MQIPQEAQTYNQNTGLNPALYPYGQCTESLSTPSTRWKGRSSKDGYYSDRRAIKVSDSSPRIEWDLVEVDDDEAEFLAEMEGISNGTADKANQVLGGRNPELNKRINRAMDKYNRVHEACYQSTGNIQNRPSLQAVGGSSVDESIIKANKTTDVRTFQTVDLNLDFRTMTQGDIENMYKFLGADAVIGPNNRKLPLIEAVQLAKVKVIDNAMDAKDMCKARPVAYKDIPVKPEPKKGWLSKAKSAVGSAASAVGSAAKKLWRW